MFAEASAQGAQVPRVGRGDVYSAQATMSTQPSPSLQSSVPEERHDHITRLVHSHGVRPKYTLPWGQGARAKYTLSVG